MLDPPFYLISEFKYLFYVYWFFPLKEIDWSRLPSAILFFRIYKSELNFATSF
jgi:hypothetical protein